MVNAFVTGANRGIGLAIVKELLKDDTVKHVFATHRDTSDAKTLKGIRDDRLHVLEMDILYDDEQWRAVEKVSSIVKEEGLHLLVNNAGVLYDYDISGNVLRKLMCLQMEINAASSLIVVQNFLPLIRKASSSTGKAVVVNMVGSLGSIHHCDGATERGATLYRMSKAALNMMTRSLGMDLKGEGICVVSMCPGKVKTEVGGKTAEIPADLSAKALADAMLNKLSNEHAAGFFDRNLKPIPF